ncbi:hypothetical protein M3210_18310 [Oceanobacillus luteolus]|uniref:Uncharacterized protein n=1 Tax=Oceanobacillus luteolus TaxID=1274358 RepID=A0ABW4HVF2_9BACI|nr:hypothetical protein [Oceanobacillus luteolus]MCM3742191.1 hypothetical protein [Oceanobacillus luteolus]
MGKTLRLGSLFLLLLLHFNLSSAEATENTSLNLHKQSTQEIINLIPTLFHQEADNAKEKMKARKEESELVIKLEVDTVINDLQDYRIQIEKELEESKKERSLLKRLNHYEKEKEESIRKEINTEITEYLEDLLLKQ